MFARPHVMFRQAARLQLFTSGLLALLCHRYLPSWSLGILSTGFLLALHFWLLGAWFTALQQRSGGLLAFAWLWLPKVGLLGLLLLAVLTGWRPPVASLACGLLLAGPILLRAYQTTYMAQSVSLGTIDR